MVEFHVPSSSGSSFRNAPEGLLSGCFFQSGPFLLTTAGIGILRILRQLGQGACLPPKSKVKETFSSQKVHSN